MRVCVPRLQNHFWHSVSETLLPTIICKRSKILIIFCKCQKQPISQWAISLNPKWDATRFHTKSKSNWGQRKGDFDPVCFFLAPIETVYMQKWHISTQSYFLLQFHALIHPSQTSLVSSRLRLKPFWLFDVTKSW